MTFDEIVELIKKHKAAFALQRAEDNGWQQFWVTGDDSREKVYAFHLNQRRMVIYNDAGEPQDLNEEDFANLRKLILETVKKKKGGEGVQNQINKIVDLVNKNPGIFGTIIRGGWTYFKIDSDNFQFTGRVDDSLDAIFHSNGTKLTSLKDSGEIPQLYVDVMRQVELADLRNQAHTMIKRDTRFLESLGLESRAIEGVSGYNKYNIRSNGGRKYILLHNSKSMYIQGVGTEQLINFDKNPEEITQEIRDTIEYNKEIYIEDGDYIANGVRDAKNQKKFSVKSKRGQDGECKRLGEYTFFELKMNSAQCEFRIKGGEWSGVNLIEYREKGKNNWNDLDLNGIKAVREDLVKKLGITPPPTEAEIPAEIVDYINDEPSAAPSPKRKDKETKHSAGVKAAEPAAKETADLQNFKKGIEFNKDKPNPTTPYRGIGVLFEIIKGEGLKINKIFSPGVKRFKKCGEGEAGEDTVGHVDLLEGWIVTDIIRYDAKGVTNQTSVNDMDPKELAEFFHQESRVSFIVKDQGMFSCDNSINKSAIFAPNNEPSSKSASSEGTADAEERSTTPANNFSALSEMMISNQVKAKAAINQAIELGARPSAAPSSASSSRRSSTSSDLSLGGG